MTHVSQESGAGPLQRSVEIGVALATFVFGLIVISGAWKAGITWGAEGPRAGFFPFYVGLLMVIASGINLSNAVGQRTPDRFAEWGQLRQVLSVVVPTAVYVFAVPWTGFYVASFILIAVFMRWLGGYRWGLVAAVSIGVPLLTFMLFERWFMIPLPKGPVEDLLGF